MKNIILLLISFTFAKEATIAPLKTDGVLDREAIDLIEDRISEIFYQNKGFKTLRYDKQQKRFFDESVMIPSRCDVVCWAELGEKLGTPYVIYPSLTKDGRYMLLEIELISAESQTAIAKGSTYIQGGLSKAIESTIQQLDAIKTSENSISDPIRQSWVVGTSYAVGAALGVWFSLNYLSSDIDGTSANNSIVSKASRVIQ